MAETLTLSRDWLDMLDGLPDDSARWTVLKAVAGYALDGTEPDNLEGSAKDIFRTIKKTIQHRKRQTRFYTKQKTTPSESDAVKTSESDAGSESDASTSTPSESDARFFKDITNNQEIYKNIKGDIKGESETDPETPKRKIFNPPTFEEVAAYCRERNNNVDPEQFISFYQSKNWMIGKNRMKDWKAAVRTWEKYQRQKNKPPKRDYSGI